MTDSRLFSLAMLSIEASCVRSIDLDGVLKALHTKRPVPSRFDTTIM